MKKMKPHQKLGIRPWLTCLAMVLGSTFAPALRGADDPAAAAGKYRETIKGEPGHLGYWVTGSLGYWVTGLLGFGKGPAGRGRTPETGFQQTRGRDHDRPVWRLLCGSQ